MIHIGSQVRMSEEWRSERMAPTVRAKYDIGVWFSEYGPMWTAFSGHVTQIYERSINRCPTNCSRCASLPKTELTAVVVHEPVECGCTAYRDTVCERCENTYVATRSYIRVKHLENDDQ